MLWALGPVMISFTLSSEAPVLKHRVCTVSIVILHVSLRSPTSAASTLLCSGRVLTAAAVGMPGEPRDSV